MFEQNGKDEGLWGHTDILISIFIAGGSEGIFRPEFVWPAVWLPNPSILVGHMEHRGGCVRALGSLNHALQFRFGGVQGV